MRFWQQGNRYGNMGMVKKLGGIGAPLAFAGTAVVFQDRFFDFTKQHNGVNIKIRGILQFRVGH